MAATAPTASTSAYEDEIYGISSPTAQRKITLTKKIPGDTGAKPDVDKEFQIVTCLNDFGVFELSFLKPEGMCRGYVTDISGMRNQLIMFDSSDLSVHLSVGISGDYYIEFTTEKGNIYYGSTVGL